MASAAASIAVDSATIVAGLVLVRVPDPKGRKVQRHEFYRVQDGTAHFSSSGILLHETEILPNSPRSQNGCMQGDPTNSEMGNRNGSSECRGSRSFLGAALTGGLKGEEERGKEGERGREGLLVLTCAQVLSSAILLPDGWTTGRPQAESGKHILHPELVPGTEIRVAAECAEKCGSEWKVVEFPAAVVLLFEVPGMLSCMQRLQLGQSGCTNSTKALDPQRSLLGHLAVLRVSASFDILSAKPVIGAFEDKEEGASHPSSRARERGISSRAMGERGMRVLVSGTPFGAISQYHFFNSVVEGVVSNCVTASERGRGRDSSSPESPSLFLLDINCPPGMEGGPVVDEEGHLFGVLAPAIRVETSAGSNSAVHVQVAISILAALPALQAARNIESFSRGEYSALASPPLSSSSSAPPFFFFPPNPSSSFYSSIPSSHLSSSTNLQSVGSNGGWTEHPIHIPLSAPRCTDSPPTQRSSGGKHLPPPRPLPLPTQPPLSSQPAFQSALESVVVVEVGGAAGAWASGVVISEKGLILTNAHVVSSKPIPSKEAKHPSKGMAMAPAFRIRVDRQRENGSFMSVWYPALPIFVARGPLDVALLEIAPSSIPTSRMALTNITPLFTAPSLGSPAFVVGHGLFPPHSGLMASVRAGIVSRVVYLQGASEKICSREGGVGEISGHSEGVQRAGESGRRGGGGGEGAAAERERRNVPRMMQTTAAVHAGASGGAVVDDHGRFIGLVTSNARIRGGALLPHLNFCIPAAPLSPLFRFAVSGNLGDLDALNESDLELNALWALSPLSPPPSTSPSSPAKYTKEEPLRGNKFSKFLKELEKKKHMAIGPGQVHGDGHLPVPSKL